MAVAPGMLGLPAPFLSSILCHSLKPASSTGSASPGRFAVHFSGASSRFSGPRTARVEEGTGRTSPTVSSESDNRETCVGVCRKLADSGRISSRKLRDRGRGFFSMAAATSDVSQTMPVEEGAEYKIQEQILTHQRAAAKLSPVEEARTVVHQTTLGTLSTISKKYDGFPVGSMVIYAMDDDGSIILSISSMSPHTRDLELNPKCSLLVPKDPTDKRDVTITIIGEALRVSDQDEAAVRTTFLKKHPEASWVDFGDFRFMHIQPRNVRYVFGVTTGLAAVAEFTGEQFLAASVDPISQFATPIANHMNRDHADQTAQIVENSLGVKVDSALILDVDRLGFSVLAKREGIPVKLRIPFPRPAEDRKAVKTIIIEMLTQKDN